jgi:hypothetical protein
MSQSKSKLISLKEAAVISGYAPDYIGQLIRKGKLPGKQVYFNVAWMTTEEDLQNYMAKAQKRQSQQTWKDSLSDKFSEFKAKVLLETQVARIMKILLYLTIAVCIGFCLLLFYIISINIDKKIEQNAADKIETNKPVNVPPVPFKSL